MGRLLWPVALVVTFALGLAAGGVVRQSQPVVQEVDRLQQKVETLQARLRARENFAALRQPGSADSAAAPGRSSSRDATRSTDRFSTATLMEQPLLSGSPSQRSGASQTDRASSQPGSRGTTAPTATVQMALDRFYRYLEATSSADWRERAQRTRELVEDLRAMGSAGAQALMHVLAAGNDSEERRAAARLLGTLQVPQSLPLLRDIIDKDNDVLLRRTAASALRQLQTPESVPVMERLLTTPSEDRFVRLSAAYGLAQSGKPIGVTGLTQIFEESTADGRGREIAFRSLNSLQDERPLPFMRELVASQAEPSYRLQAIKYVTAHGDRQALASLQLVMHAPNEQPSIRDAAAQAYATISGK